MRAARIAAFLFACLLAATLAGGAAAKAKPKPKHHAKKHHVAKKKAKAKAPVFDARYDCVKAMSIPEYESFFAAWQGNVAYRDGKVPPPYVDANGGGCYVEYVHTDGPYAGQPGAGNMGITYGAKAAKGYNGFEHTATIRGHQACPNGVPAGADPRQCGPVQVAGIGDKAYECFYYITALKGDVWVVLAAGGGLEQNGQYPPTDKLEAAMKAILAKLP